MAEKTLLDLSDDLQTGGKDQVLLEIETGGTSDESQQMNERTTGIMDINSESNVTEVSLLDMSDNMTSVLESGTARSTPAKVTSPLSPKPSFNWSSGLTGGKLELSDLQNKMFESWTQQDIKGIKPSSPTAASGVSIPVPVDSLPLASPTPTDLLGSQNETLAPTMESNKFNHKSTDSKRDHEDKPTGKPSAPDLGSETLTNAVCANTCEESSISSKPSVGQPSPSTMEPVGTAETPGAAGQAETTESKSDTGPLDLEPLPGLNTILQHKYPDIQKAEPFTSGSDANYYSNLPATKNDTGSKHKHELPAHTVVRPVGFSVDTLRIYVHKTDITKLYVDAIVISGNDKLVHRDGVGKAVATAAGAAFASACVAAVNKSGPLPETTVISTASGLLPCRQVLHAVYPHWEKSFDLMQTVNNALKQAAENKCSSLAVSVAKEDPASRPNLMVDAWLRPFLSITSGKVQSPLRELHFISTENDTLEILIRSLEQHSSENPHVKTINGINEHLLKLQNPLAQQGNCVSSAASNKSAASEDLLTYVIDQTPVFYDNILDKFRIDSPVNSEKNHTFSNPEYMDFDPLMKPVGSRPQPNATDHGTSTDQRPTAKTEDLFTLFPDTIVDGTRPKTPQLQRMNEMPPKLPPRPSHHKSPLTSVDQTELSRHGNAPATGDLTKGWVSEIPSSVYSTIEPTVTDSPNKLQQNRKLPSPPNSTPSERHHTYTNENIYEPIDERKAPTDKHGVPVPTPRKSVQAKREAKPEDNWCSTVQRQNLQNISHENYNPTLPTGFIMGGVVRIVVHEHDITKLKVGAIVNPTNTRLRFSQNISKAIAKGAGAELVEECHNITSVRGILHETELIETRGWQLPSQHIFHVVLPKWPDTGGGSQQQHQMQHYNFLEDVKSTYENVFAHANRIGLKTIAFSALKTGSGSIPTELVTNAVCEAIFSSIGNGIKSDAGSLESIHIVDTSPINLSSFVTKLPKGSRKAINQMKITNLSESALLNAITCVSDVKHEHVEAIPKMEENKVRSKSQPRVTAEARKDQPLRASPEKHTRISEHPKQDIPSARPKQKELAPIDVAVRPKSSPKAKTPHVEFRPRCFQIAKKVHVVLHMCDITTMNIDAIVCPTNSQLQPNGTIHKAISGCAGPTMQEYCEEILQNQALVQVADVVQTPPGSLPCRAVFHTVPPKWPPSNKAEHQRYCLEKLQLTMENILHEANQCGAGSLAMPPIGSGISRIPKHNIAEMMCKALLEHGARTQQGDYVKEIHIVSLNTRTLQLLIDHFEKACHDSVNTTVVAVDDKVESMIKACALVPEVAKPLSEEGRYTAAPGAAASNVDQPDYSAPKFDHADNELSKITEEPPSYSNIMTSQDDSGINMRSVPRDRNRNSWGDEEAPQNNSRKSKNSLSRSTSLTCSLPNLAAEPSVPRTFSARGYRIQDKNLQVELEVYLHMHIVSRMGTDAIVNPTDKRLKHHKGLSRLVAEIAGPQMKAECQKLIKHSKVPTTCVLATGPGLLPCRYVLHSVIPKWPTKEDAGLSTQSLEARSVCLQEMRTTFHNIFAKVTEIGCMKSISIPLMSTGVPSDDMAAITFDTLLANCGTKSLEEIHVVNVRPDFLWQLANKLDAACDKQIRGLQVHRLGSDVQQAIHRVVSSSDTSQDSLYSEIPSDADSRYHKKTMKLKGGKSIGRFFNSLTPTKKS